MTDRFTLSAMKCSAFEWIARFRRDRFTLLIACIAGLGAAHILVRTATYGLAATRDSSILLSTAMNFLAGEGWQDFAGSPVIGWPPLFPLLLVAGGWIGIEPAEAGRWVNATAFGLTILVAGGWLRSKLRSQWLVLAATATIAASLPLSELASRFLTEPLFCLFTLLALIQLAAFLERRTDAPLRWAAVCTALAALTRWPSVVLIGTGVLLLWPLARRKQTLVFGAVPSVPMLAVMVRNWAVSGDLTQATGERNAISRQSLSDGLNQIVGVVREWVVPPNAPDGLAYLLWLVVATVGLAGATVLLRALRMHRDGSRPDPEAVAAHVRLEPAIPFGLFALVYPAFLVTVAPFTVAQAIDTRYLLPVYVPSVLVAALLLDRFLSIEAAGRRAAIRYGLAFLVLLGALVHGGFSAHRHLHITAKGYVVGFKSWTFNGAYWEPSETLNYIRTRLREGMVYSNNPYLTWFWDKTADPGKHQYLPQVWIHKLMPHIMQWPDGTHIVWLLNENFYYYNGNFYYYKELDVRCLPGVETVAELSDGVVFRVTKAEPFDMERHRACKQRYVDQVREQVGERVVRADWDVYRNGRKLTYLKEPCAPSDVQAKFVLRVIPADPKDLSSFRQRYGYDNLAFYFDRRGVRRGDQCMATAQLPDYPIDRIQVGQWISAEDRTVWEAEFALGRSLVPGVQ